MLVTGVNPVAIYLVWCSVFYVFCRCLCLMQMVTILWKHTQYVSCYGFVCGEYCFLCFLHVVGVSVLSICSVLHAFVVVLSRCFLYVRFESE